jgi:hypothetical protein
MITHQVSGWARACAGAANPDCTGGAVANGAGWDGWIKLRKDPSDSGPDYGLLIDDSIEPHQFKGWAWGSDVIGWLSFNCSDTGTCAGSDYKVATSFVFNRAPQVSSQSLAQNYCNVAPGVGQVSFQWRYTDQDNDSQSSFIFQVDNNINFNSPEVNRQFTGLSNPSPSTNTQTVLVVGTPQADKITFGPTYYWRVQVSDARGKSSGWSSPLSFTTSSHGWPWPTFTFSPSNPTKGERVSFKDNSTCYGGGNSEYPCKNSAANTYLWDFGDGTFSSQRGDTTHIYQTTDTFPVWLTVTDATVGSCKGEPPVTINISLPEFEEITPF